MKVSFASAPKASDTVLALTLAKGAPLGPHASKADQEMGGAISRAMKVDASFEGAAEQVLHLVAPESSGHHRVVLLGLGDPAALDAAMLERLGGALCGRLKGLKAASASLQADLPEGCALGLEEIGAHIAYGAKLASYAFTRYKSKPASGDKKPTSPERLTVAGSKPAAARKLFGPLQAIADGVFLARDLVTEPPNVLYPETFAERCLALKDLGVEVTVLDEKKMEKLGMQALLAVGMGSSKRSKLVVMRWKGAKPSKAKSAGAKSAGPVCLVGKGITFDTGGISLKPAAGMWDMKFDMGGAAAVTGAMAAVAGRKAKADVVGIIALAENMPAGNAQRPGDIVKSASGKTIEVLNTDAEGRLVLCDALWYAQEKFKPSLIVDLATLTGAILVALGHEMAGLFSNNDDLSEKLTAAGTMVDEPVWRMPLGKAYDRAINSDVADIKNIGAGRWAGSIVAAQFLQRFIEGDTPWAHLDIAGTAWSEKSRPTAPKGASGWGVRLLSELVAAYE